MAKNVFHTCNPLFLRWGLFIGLIVTMAGIYSCVTVYDTINNRNYAAQYSPGNLALHPEYRIYMKSPGDLRLYYRFFPKELVYLIDPIDSIPYASVSIFYRVTHNYSSTQIVDSLTKNIVLKGTPRTQYLGFMPVRLPDEGKYVMEVFLTDVNTKTTVSTVIEYQHSKKGTSQSFMNLSKSNNPTFQTFFTPMDTIRVRTEMFEQHPVYVSYYKPVVDLPVPPDIPQNKTIEPEPIDTSWIITKLDTTLFCFHDKGTYLFSSGKIATGMPLGCFQNYYPYIKSPQAMLNSLGYLVTEKELESLKMLGDDKQALDTFWTASTNDLNKSRELIRVYYNRVQMANYFFYDYREGWITDRGMIYIICGAPATIRKTDEGEYWLYGKGENESTRFFFYRENHPVFGPMYILERSELYQRMWFNAVTTWREGRVFSLNP